MARVYGATSSGLPVTPNKSDYKSKEDDKIVLVGAETFSEHLQTGSNNKECINKLQIQVVKLEKQVQELKTKVSKLESDLKTKDEEITLLLTKVTDIEKELAESKKDSNKIYLSQIAVEFERAICSTVLPEVFQDNWHTTLEDLLHCLNSDDEDEIPLDPAKYNISVILSKARNKWAQICQNLKVPNTWTPRKRDNKFIYNSYKVPKIFRAILLLKQGRNVVAHPNPVSLQKGEDIIRKEDSTLKLGLTSDDFELAKSFITSVRLYIQQSGVEIDGKKLITSN